jgi:hypothetical protein
MARKKKPQPVAPEAPKAKQLPPPAPPALGPPVNVRPAGPMADKRTRRRRTRSADEHHAIDEEV